MAMVPFPVEPGALHRSRQGGK